MTHRSGPSTSPAPLPYAPEPIRRDPPRIDVGIVRAGFDIDLRDGVRVENDVLRALIGGTTIEVKFQPNARTHLFVETECRGKPSGLSVTTADHWVFVYDQGDHWIVIRTDRLRDLARTQWRHTRGGDYGASVGIAIPIADMAAPRGDVRGKEEAWLTTTPRDTRSI